MILRMVSLFPFSRYSLPTFPRMIFNNPWKSILLFIVEIVFQKKSESSLVCFYTFWTLKVGV